LTLVIVYILCIVPIPQKNEPLRALKLSWSVNLIKKHKTQLAFIRIRI
jgi:hypothetical protein